MKTALSCILLPLSFLLFSVLFFSNTLHAQDSIVLVNNTVILAKVEAIDLNDIKYHKADNINGPLYDLPKSQIYEIIYINGTVDIMTPQQGSTGQQDNTVPPATTTTGQPVNESQQSNTNQPDNSIQTNQGQPAQQYNQAQQNQQDNSNQQNQQYNQQDNALGPNTQYQAPPQQPPVTMQTFYDQLSPYGNWVNSPAYGYVWVPNVGMDFTPYGTNGHWAYTDYGWTWVSDFPWGWAAFHYGRWYFDPYLGYVWTPTTVWGPAWVSWRSNQGYYGWAPMGPAGYQYPSDLWVFVGAGYITNEQVYNYYEPRHNATVIYNNTTVVQNSYVERGGVQYVTGPSRNEVEHVTHTTITPQRIVTSNNPGESMHSNGQVVMYHPAVQSANANGPAKPAQVIKAEQVTPVAQRTTVVHQVINNQHIEPAQQQNNYNRRESEQQHVTPAEQPRYEEKPEQHTEPAQQQNNNARPAQQQQQPRPQQPRQPKPAPKPNNPKPAQPEKKK